MNMVVNVHHHISVEFIVQPFTFKKDNAFLNLVDLYMVC
jgi:hypothetical protein